MIDLQGAKITSDFGVFLKAPAWIIRAAFSRSLPYPTFQA
jgi:hypothetical protein